MHADTKRKCRLVYFVHETTFSGEERERMLAVPEAGIWLGQREDNVRTLFLRSIFYKRSIR